MKCPLAAATISFGVLLSALRCNAKKPTNTGKPGGKDPLPSEPSFVDSLTSFDTTKWAKSGPWSNGSPFANGWDASAVTFNAEEMMITLDDTPYVEQTNTYPYTSGELRTTGFYGYGCYEVTMKPVAQSGVVTAFSTFAGPDDNPTGGNGKHNEIDIEFLGKDTTYFQANYWTNDDRYSNGHEYIVNLGFDASQGYHRYGFRWTSTGIEWYVDGSKVYEVVDKNSDPVPKTTDTTQKIVMNLWPVDSSVSAWAGPFSYPGAPMEGGWRDVSFEEGENCIMTGPSSTTTVATSSSTSRTGTTTSSSTTVATSSSTSPAGTTTSSATTVATSSSTSRTGTTTSSATTVATSSSTSGTGTTTSSATTVATSSSTSATGTTTARTRTVATGSVRVANIGMSLVTNTTQALAAVTVVDSSNQAVSGAVVKGVWSGLVTGGDGNKDTDAGGEALLYSMRRNRGALTFLSFCVTDIIASELDFVADAINDCKSISK